MAGFSDEYLQNIENFFSVCDHILEEDLSDQAINKMQEHITCLQEQSEDYKCRLKDQEYNSKSEFSRNFASVLLTEDEKIENLIQQNFPAEKSGAAHPCSDRDVNIGALYVEYLTDRAMQSIREALIGTMKLKVLSAQTEDTI